MDIFNFDRIAKSTAEKLESEINRIGLFYRIFYRVKSSDSIERKIANKMYFEKRKKMQDLIGVRIVAYFKDDVDLLINTLKDKFECITSTIDQDNENLFQPTRINLVFKLSEENSQELKVTIGSKIEVIDDTYEVQIRTIFSEGWHEVEHDLRYKCQDEWEDKKHHSRILNGIYASLETTDWSITALFDQLAYSNYTDKNIVAMIRNKFRIRFINTDIDPRLMEALLQDGILKKIYRYDRIMLLNHISKKSLRFPLTMTNMIFLLNHIYLKNPKLSELTNARIKDSFVAQNNNIEVL